jgi:hypothetical protein
MGIERISYQEVGLAPVDYRFVSRISTDNALIGGQINWHF